ncbi:hypothetical protein QJS10_CPB14g01601 [Acorus calamus]|uniref:Uncharacterized protein n=1 Tax=Acorus calamus TaxID=4465 RepID=A0AAV9DAI6_ACOCL|nr:hypothetical protein QJS10_CPB14g01601 [Acorus calamus]
MAEDEDSPSETNSINSAKNLQQLKILRQGKAPSKTRLMNNQKGLSKTAIALLEVIIL